MEAHASLAKGLLEQVSNPQVPISITSDARKAQWAEVFAMFQEAGHDSRVGEITQSLKQLQAQAEECLKNYNRALSTEDQLLQSGYFEACQAHMQQQSQLQNQIESMTLSIPAFVQQQQQVQVPSFVQQQIETQVPQGIDPSPPQGFPLGPGVGDILVNMSSTMLAAHE